MKGKKVSDRFEEKFLFFADVKIVIEFYLRKNTRQPASQHCRVCAGFAMTFDACVWKARCESLQKILSTKKKGFSCSSLLHVTHRVLPKSA